MNTWKALQFMTISTLAFTVMSSLIKYLDAFHSLEFVFFRCIGSLLICYVVLKAKRIPLKGNQQKLLIGRGIAGVSSMILFFGALKLLPFGTTISLRYTAPIFAAVFSIIFLKEKLRPVQWLYFLIAFIGVLLLKGFDLRVSGIGLIMIMGAAVLSGLVYVFLRAIGPRDHPVVVVFYFMLIASIVGAIGTIPVWKNPVGVEWIVLISLGIFGYLGQLYMTKAFQVEEANKVAPMKYMEAVFAILAGWVWFQETYSWIGILGMFLVLAGMLLNMTTKKIENT